VLERVLVDGNHTLFVYQLGSLNSLWNLSSWVHVQVPVVHGHFFASGVFEDGLVDTMVVSYLVEPYFRKLIAPFDFNTTTFRHSEQFFVGEWVWVENGLRCSDDELSPNTLAVGF